MCHFCSTLNTKPTKPPTPVQPACPPSPPPQPPIVEPPGVAPSQAEMESICQDCSICMEPLATDLAVLLTYFMHIHYTGLWLCVFSLARNAGMYSITNGELIHAFILIPNYWVI